MRVVRFLLLLALGAASVGIFVWLLGRMIPEHPAARILAVVATANPLFLQNAARVANDALAIFFGMIALAILLAPARRGGPVCGARSGRSPDSGGQQAPAAGPGSGCN